MTSDTKSENLALAWTIASLLLLETILLPIVITFGINLFQGDGYLSGMILLSLPRVIGVVVIAVAIEKLVSRPRLLIATVVYASILLVRFFMSEVFIGPSLLAKFTATFPYIVGLAAFVIAHVGVRLTSSHRALSRQLLR